MALCDSVLKRPKEFLANLESAELNTDGDATFKKSRNASREAVFRVE